MTPRSLPPPVESVAIPHFLSPSRFLDLLDCPLRVLAEGAGSELSPTPELVHGSLLHHVREQVARGRWGAASTARTAFDQLLERAARELDELLAADHVTAGLVPLRQAVGRTRWNTRRFEGLAWANLLDVGRTDDAPVGVERILKKGRNPNSPTPERDRVDTGPEAWIVARDLRLRGRADHIADSGATVDVTDYKSGAILDQEGNALQRHHLQVRLYGLAVEHVAGRLVRLFLEGGAKIQVPWDAGTRETVAALLADMLEQLPAGNVVDAQALARPGTVCRGCRLRATCQPYLSQAAQWWPNRPESPRPAPLDVWGTIRSVTRGATGATVELLDAAERHVRIDGLALERTSALAPGVRLYCFNVESSEPTIMHGARLQPRNFHERPPRIGLRRARCVQLFVE